MTAQAQPTPPTSPPEPLQFPTSGTGSEAPASINFRFTMEGTDLQLTLRGTSGVDVLGKAKTALGWIAENGGALEGSTPDTPPQTLAQGQPPACPTHGRAMVIGRKSGEWMCPSKDDGKYCKYTLPKT